MRYFSVYSYFTLAIMIAMSVRGMAQSAAIANDTTLPTSIEANLAMAPIQEKPYLHIDNNSYFIGDTIWYKAYVMSADSLHLTSQSRILYVELVSPDGLVVKRQRKMIASNGWGDGDFALPDTLYSGYYELRAYTRWMMNFDITEHYNSVSDRKKFFNRQMAKDFFREYGTVWSRVVPVYEKPSVDGDYSDREIVPRPRQRALKPNPERLLVTFYPEGGHLIAGTRCRVAFEAVNEQGEGIDIDGKIGDMAIRSTHMGRGAFWIDVPEDDRLTATFTYRGKEYDFKLPKADDTGLALTVDGKRAIVQKRGKVPQSLHAVLLCGGVPRSSMPMLFDASGMAELDFDLDKLPTGVCDLVIYDTTAQVLADRLFFVNHHDYDGRRVLVGGMKDSYAPYEQINLEVQAPADTRLISLSVRDKDGDEPCYSTGNMLTDLLLTSDIKGFVAQPDYYFEADDSVHRAHLDLLLMVQGWRRYDFHQLAQGNKQLRYRPERSIEVEGSVYPYIGFFDLEPESMDALLHGGNPENLYDKLEKSDKNSTNSNQNPNLSSDHESSAQADNVEAIRSRAKEYGVNHGGLKNEVTVEGDLYVWEDSQYVAVAFSVDTHNGGFFRFYLNPFYGEARLWLSAHKQKVSSEKWEKKYNKDFYKEDADPDYYVKLNLFYPIFAREYSFYETHLPPFKQSFDGNEGLTYKEGEDGLLLPEAQVKARRRRGKRAIDWSKPICTYDAMDLYNLVTDYGLSWGKLDNFSFISGAATVLFGTYGDMRSFKAEGRIDNYRYYCDYEPEMMTLPTGEQIEVHNMVKNKSNYAIYEKLKLSRWHNIRFYTDFSMRDEHRWLDRSMQQPDIIVDVETIADNGKRSVIRDRSVHIQGFSEPDDFYHPDYSRRPLPEQKDYRRTLYWNPNLLLDRRGHTTISFYNNGKDTQLKVSAAGVGRLGPVCGQ